jgi:hypothetical protein
MNQSDSKPAACFNCGKSEDEFPLVQLKYSGKQVLICPQCLPALIHHPDKLAEKILQL